MHAAGIFRDVAAYRAGDLRRRDRARNTSHTPRPLRKSPGCARPAAPPRCARTGSSFDDAVRSAPVDSTTPSAIGIAPPDNPVPAPRGTIGTSQRMADLHDVAAPALPFPATPPPSAIAGRRPDRRIRTGACLLRRTADAVRRQYRHATPSPLRAGGSASTCDGCSTDAFMSLFVRLAAVKPATVKRPNDLAGVHQIERIERVLDACASSRCPVAVFLRCRKSILCMPTPCSPVQVPSMRERALPPCAH